MQNERMTDSSVSISDKNLETPKVAYDDGTYEASYNGLSVFMEDTPWGNKKRARLYFIFTRGKYKGLKTSFRGDFLEDKESGGWLVGSKSKLAAAIRAVTGGDKTIDEGHKGRRVFVKIVKKTKKDGTGQYSLVEEVIAAPDDEEGVSDAAQSMAQPAQAPRQQVAQAVRTVQPATPLVTPAAKPKVPPAAVESSGGLLDDLTELSDFQE